MSDLAIRVEALSKFYPAHSLRAGPAHSLAVWRPGVGWAGHIGAPFGRQQRNDTTSTVLSAGLRDALVARFRRADQQPRDLHAT